MPTGTTAWTSANPQGWPNPFQPVFPFDVPTHGVSLSTGGTLTFGPNAKVRNFIVNAVQGTTKVPIRIHRHDRLDSAELTPPKLALHQSEGTQVRFSVLAIFKDDVNGVDVPCVADISQQPGLTWSMSPSTDAALTPDGSGFVVPLGQNASSSATVTLTLPADLLVGANPLPPLTGQIQLAPAWDTPLQDGLRCIGGPGFGQIDNVPNVLILPDGFPSKTEFQDVVNALVVKKVCGSPTLAPWNKFLVKDTGVVNCWIGWVPSPEEGGNELNELRRIDKTAPAVPFPVEPTGNAIVNLPNLIYRVGLPTLADGLTPSFDAQNAIWQQLYSSNSTYLTGLTSGLWADWKALATRFLAREVDTTFGISIGHRPQLPAPSILNIGLHPFRTRRRNIDLLLSQLFVDTAGQGRVTVGARWASGDDKDKVVILSKGPHERGTDNHLTGVVALTPTDEDASSPEVLSAVPTIVTLKVPPIPPDLATAASTFTHELSHVFNAGDEYVKLGLNLPADSIDGTQSSYWNLIVDREARDQTGKLSVAGMRWAQWPRVAAGSVVTGYPTIVDAVPFDRIQVQLAPKGAKAFRDAKIAVGALFRFRQKTFVTFTKINGVQTPRPIEFVMSPAMKLVTIDDQNDRIDLDEVALGSIDDWITAFRDPFVTDPGLRLLAIQLDATGTELPVMHPAIASHIISHGTNGRPLNRKPNTGDQCVFDARPVQPSDGLRDLPSSITLPSVVSRVIGLYDGGATYSCGVFHAAGGCLMRSDTTVPEGDPRSPDPPRKLRKLRAATYCHVCRYLLVDQIAPRFHADIDSEYKGNYPK